MIATNDDALANSLRLLRSHGMTVTSWDRDKGRPAAYDVLEVGFNFRFDDIRAAIGLVQLEKLPQFNSQRANLVSRYNEQFSQWNSGVILPYALVSRNKQSSFHIYPIVLPSSAERDAVAEGLKAQGIQTSIHYPPIHYLSAFKRMDRRVCLPLTEAFASRELTLPLYPSLPPGQVDQIVGGVHHALSSVHSHS